MCYKKEKEEEELKRGKKAIIRTKGVIWNRHNKTERNKKRENEEEIAEGEEKLNKERKTEKESRERWKIERREGKKEILTGGRKRK